MRRKSEAISKYAYILNRTDLYLAIGYSNMVRAVVIGGVVLICY